MTKMRSLYLKIASIALICLLSTACQIGPRPYKFPVQQGNMITSTKVSSIKTGMTESQVQYILGTPMIQDIFHTHRWDYVYYDKQGYQEPTSYHVAVYFENGRVSSITSDPIRSNSANT